MVGIQNIYSFFWTTCLGSAFEWYLYLQLLVVSLKTQIDTEQIRIWGEINTASLPEIRMSIYKPP